MTYTRSSAVPKDCNLGRIAAMPRSHTHTVGSVPHVAVGLLSQSVQALSPFVPPPVVTTCQSD